MRRVDAAQSLQKQANDLRNNGQGLEAVEKYQRAAREFLQAGNKTSAAECWHMAGVSYKVENDIDKAVATLQQAIELYEQAGNQMRVGHVYRDIGIAYAYRKEHDKAIEWLKKSENILSNNKAEAELGITRAKIGLHYLEIKQYDQARQWLDLGLASIRQEGQWFYEMTALSHLAALELAQNRFSGAVTTLWAGIGLIYQADEQKIQKRRLAQLYGLLAHGYLGLGNAKDGANFFKKAVVLLKSMADNVSSVVYEDIQAQDFVKKLRDASPQDYERLKKARILAGGPVVFF